MKLSKIIVMFLVICNVVVLAGCGGSSTKTADKKAKSDYPKKEITIVVPWNAGGGIDLMARTLQTILKDEMGMTVIVKNVPGGSGVMGMSEVMSAKPDGYTLGVQTASTLGVMALGKSSLKTDKFTNITLLAEDPHVFVVRQDAPWKDLKEFIEYARANPNKVTVATVGTNNVNHAIISLLGTKTKVELQAVPFDGAALVVPAIMGGHINAAVLKPSEGIPHVKSGKFRVLAVNGDARLKALPDTPTFKEHGVDLWGSQPLKQISILAGPANMDPATRDRVIEIFNKAVQSPKYQKLANEYGFIAPTKTMQQLDKDVDDFVNNPIFKTVFNKK